MMNKKAYKRIIPGFGLSFGITLLYLGFIVIIPLCSLVIFTAGISPGVFLETVTRPSVLSSYMVSFSTALAAAVVDAVMGVIIAWVLVRYQFPGKKLMNGIIELPFALPTAVAGISLTHLTTDKGWIGKMFHDAFGIDIAYTRLGITVALVFIGIPFVVRSVEPVLEKMDRGVEEAADMLGAGRTKIFFDIILPEIAPALFSGFSLSFARGLGEYGSVVFIAGNKPYETEIAPLMILSQLQEYDYTSATAIALVMLIAAFIILLINSYIQSRSAKITGGMA